MLAPMITLSLSAYLFSSLRPVPFIVTASTEHFLTHTLLDVFPNKTTPHLRGQFGNSTNISSANMLAANHVLLQSTVI